MTSRRAIISGIAALATLSFAGAAVAQDPLSPFRAGQHYRVLEKPQPTTVGAGKVEVIEAFWYGCSHCFALDPAIEQWNSKKPPYVEFTRVPVTWGPPHRQHAKLYYTVQALRRPDLHAQIFDAIHKHGLTLADPDETRTRLGQREFVVAFGVTPEQFDAAFDSMTVATNMQRAETLTRAMRITSVPMLFVNGKYATSMDEAGGQAQLFQLLDKLVASEKR